MADGFRSPILNPLAALFDGHKGSKVLIPNIESLSPTWIVSKNSHYELIHDDYTAWVHHWYQEEKIRKKLEDLDAPLSASLAFPRTGRDELLTLAKFIGWYFPWDDVIDDASSLQQPEDICKYRDDTIKLVEQSLNPNPELHLPPHPNPAIQSFWGIGCAIRATGTPASNQELVDQQRAFITSSTQAQTERKHGIPIAIEKYLERREENIGIHNLMALIPYAYHIELPAHLSYRNNARMRSLRRETVRMIAMANDLLSLRRELMYGQYESLVPLLTYHDNLSPQAAVARVVAMLHASYQRFHDEESALRAEAAPSDLDVLNVYLSCYKDVVICNLHWSYGLKRYMEKDMVQPDGSVLFAVELPPRGS